MSLYTLLTKATLRRPLEPKLAASSTSCFGTQGGARRSFTPRSSREATASTSYRQSCRKTAGRPISGRSRAMDTRAPPPTTLSPAIWSTSSSSRNGRLFRPAASDCAPPAARDEPAGCEFTLPRARLFWVSGRSLGPHARPPASTGGESAHGLSVSRSSGGHTDMSSEIPPAGPTGCAILYLRSGTSHSHNHQTGPTRSLPFKDNRPWNR